MALRHADEDLVARWVHLADKAGRDEALLSEDPATGVHDDERIPGLVRRLVDGAETIKLWNEDYRVRIRVHTIGGLSAHADQQDLMNWYGAFENRPPLYLVHGERKAQEVLQQKLRAELDAPVQIAQHAEVVEIGE